MQSIETYYLGPTNYRPSRIKAKAPNGQTATVSYDYGLSDDMRHAKAARALANKLNWPGKLIGGHTSRGMVWVWLSDASPVIETKSDEATS